MLRLSVEAMVEAWVGDDECYRVCCVVRYDGASGGWHGSGCLTSSGVRPMVVAAVVRKVMITDVVYCDGDGMVWSMAWQRWCSDSGGGGGDFRR
ncbi:hypothetical protein Tco_0381432 [Tanacetum coccineum]